MNTSNVTIKNMANLKTISMVQPLNIKTLLPELIEGVLENVQPLDRFVASSDLYVSQKIDYWNDWTHGNLAISKKYGHAAFLWSFLRTQKID